MILRHLKEGRTLNYKFTEKDTNTGADIVTIVSVGAEPVEVSQEHGVVLLGMFGSEVCRVDEPEKTEPAVADEPPEPPPPDGMAIDFDPDVDGAGSKPTDAPPSEPAGDSTGGTHPPEEILGRVLANGTGDPPPAEYHCSKCKHTHVAPSKIYDKHKEFKVIEE